MRANRHAQKLLSAFIYCGTLSCLLITQSYAEDIPGFDSGVGKWGLAEEQKYHEDQKAAAEKVVAKINPKSVEHHP